MSEQNCSVVLQKRQEIEHLPGFMLIGLRGALEIM